MSTVFPSARIILVEPSASNAATARLNLMGRRVFVEQAAVWGAGDAAGGGREDDEAASTGSVRSQVRLTPGNGVATRR